MAFKHIFIIGAQRSGSTLLANILDLHPVIQLAQPIRPEPKYFVSERNSFSLSDYLFKHFPSIQPEVKWLAEKSTTYYESIDSIKRINSAFSDSLFLIILRHPVQRALSNYKFSVENGIENRTPEEVFISNIPAPPLAKKLSTDPFNYIGRSKYSNYIRPIIEEIGEERLFVIILEELVDNLDTLNPLLQQMGLSSHLTTLSTNYKVNSSSLELDIAEDIHSILNGRLNSEVKNVESLIGREIKAWNS